MFVNLFGKDCGDYTRYWISVSTEVWDGKKKKGTGEYIRASLSASLSKEAAEVFEDNAKKTKDKKIKGGRFEVKGAFFKAVDRREGEPFVTFYIHDMAPVEEEDRNQLRAIGRGSISDEDDIHGFRQGILQRWLPQGLPGIRRIHRDDERPLPGGLQKGGEEILRHNDEERGG